MNLRICMVAYTFYETDNRVMRYAEELVRRGDEVDVIALKKEGQEFRENIGGVNLFRIQERKINERGRLSYLFRILKFLIRSGYFLTKRQLKYRYDIIHVHSVPDFEVYAAIIPKLLGAKIILDIHDIVPEFYASKFNADADSFLYKLLVLVEKRSARFSDHVIISNHIWEKRLEFRSTMPKKCTTIMNYPDESWEKTGVRTVSNDKFIMMYPGTLNWHQGLDIAVKATAIIKERCPKAELHIYGEGPAKDALRQQITNLGLQNRVVLNDPLPVKLIREVMANADLGIVPKRNDGFGGEAFSTKTLEFMSLGVPIIVSRTKIDQYYFNDSVVKFFTPENSGDLANAMLEMISNRELRERQAENALRFVEKYKWQANKHLYLDLVDCLAKNKQER